MVSVEDRFKAAVNVIKGLPKNGPYQPSTAMMLKFYGYYKQATEGPCHQKKPGFWDIVGKAKWDAWNDNRHLTKEEAMNRYVDSLREIIDTMSFTVNVQDFVGSLSDLDNINLDELEMVAPGMRELAESHPNSPFNSRTNSPQHGVSTNSGSTNLNNNAEPTANGHVMTSYACEPNNNDIIGTDATVPPFSVQNQSAVTDTNIIPSTYTSPLASIINMSNGNIDQSDDEYADPLDVQSEFVEAMAHNSELLKQIQLTVQHMNSDLATVNQRVSVVEKTLQDLSKAVQTLCRNGTSRRVSNTYPKWWPFTNISPAWFAFLILWPFIVNRLSHILAVGRRKRA
ncbi:acyl-CoA-binding domain-containing protein 5 [Teleopsis dalmanni]|uniref:acyl-CoA-binding domain-containing protein 5 n=1 Tax=Teleopsis dalmanni TaxID=139649 RepID=UPI000D329B16|nr:acyl-CoA-binding domain-containing protein 5 [Teleopsis dalmanni]XP_037957271.1 acyl-CoA-binding domain-containing protein 5 [Teleopsis dalmanni]XP_037957272.1 acyl-CoA-binding domain-containing protein 5 [Teleopsis dalmanni]